MKKRLSRRTRCPERTVYGLLSAEVFYSVSANIRSKAQLLSTLAFEQKLFSCSKDFFLLFTAEHMAIQAPS